MIEEIWKPIELEGFENIYYISNYGRIKTLGREWYKGCKRKKLKKERIIKLRIKQGYACVKLNNNKKYVQMRVHRLVAMAFIPNPENKPDINHKDGIRSNNYFSNLEWCTKSENMQHAYDIGLKKPCHGELSGQSKLSNTDVIEIIDLFNSGIRKCEIAHMFNVTRTTISNITNGKVWTHITKQKLSNGKAEPYIKRF